jgi:hypothetical protein
VSKLLAAGLITAVRLAAATLEIHSEFLRVNPRGEILPVDATPKPREILSPAVVRNGFASFHIVVRSRRPESYFLFVSTNPPDVFRTALYKEEFVNRGGSWIPDALTPFRPPNFGAIPDGEASIPDQTACAYLLDVWVPPDVRPGAARLEVQLKVGSWIIYPMEIRVLPARVPELRSDSQQELPEVEQRADEAASEPFLRLMRGNGEGFGTAGKQSKTPQTLREVIRRNAEQDVALASALDAKTVIPALKEKLAASNGGGEWYLGIRDLVYRLSSRAAQ